MSVKNVLLFVSTILIFGCGKKTFEVPPTSADIVQGITYNSKVDILLMVDNS